MIIKRMNWFLKLITLCRIEAISLYPFGIYTYSNIVHKQTINHELIHWQQQREMLGIFFYIWYIIEWIIRIPINWKKAYLSISFEREAYFNDEDSYYIDYREKYAWIKYIYLK